MATIDLIVLGMLKNESLSAYDLQKLVEYRHISRWVKISTPSIYKKVLQLEEKGYITSTPTPGKLKTAGKSGLFPHRGRGRRIPTADAGDRFKPHPHFSRSQRGHRQSAQPPAPRAKALPSSYHRKPANAPRLSGRQSPRKRRPAPDPRHRSGRPPTAASLDPNTGRLAGRT